MEYILFIHNNTNTLTINEQWTYFFEQANASGLFLGGSEIANRIQIGCKPVANITHHIDGFMRFETEDKAALLALLEYHPVAMQGGTLELCEMPKSEI
jgi:hypothetical protein